MADKLRLGAVEVDHFADHIGRLDRVYLGSFQVYPKPAPTITALSPSVAAYRGGALITITGTTFYGAPTVKFGGVDAAAVTVVSETVLTAAAPAGAAGSSSVTVRTAAGLSNALPFDYLAFANQGIAKTAAQTLSTVNTWIPVTGWRVASGYEFTELEGNGIRVPEGAVVNYSLSVTFGAAASSNTCEARLMNGEAEIGVANTGTGAALTLSGSFTGTGSLVTVQGRVSNTSFNRNVIQADVTTLTLTLP